MGEPSNIIATFSIVGFDPHTEELGVAVQSKFLGVGSVVPWAKAGVGAIATQAFANPAFGPEGLTLLEKGLSAEDTLNELLKKDDQSEHRQVGIMDAQGNGATYTGKECFEWAGGVTGQNYVAQGNILVNQATVTEMGTAFEKNHGSLAERLLASLKAAQKAGGDSRGKQSAALYVVKEAGGYGGLSDVMVDLRVDDHPEPIEELERLYRLHQMYFGAVKSENIKQIEGNLKSDTASHLFRLGYLQSELASLEDILDAFQNYIYTENFEDREQKRGYLDLEVFDFLKQQASSEK
ncbi:DUF1028 domain-containing protein [Halobacillus salinarum]|uniref:DUF1028 domain-containing protein n=1 Tax=Halobacillus salinarum TaxID=2932257 RepID=A0ABY4EGU1_9BACI|nr:DUF1028 domain-containing protein [Halobacillus salinarum]UOQ43272.1 DUF1028 domain-containing protein [Halobacillus salinarum]